MLTRGTPPPGEAENRGLTHGAVTEAVVMLMRADNPAMEPDTALAATVASGIHPMLASAMASRPGVTGQDMLTGAGFATTVTQYLGSPQAGYVTDDTRRAMLAQLQRANPTS